MNNRKKQSYIQKFTAVGFFLLFFCGFSVSVYAEEQPPIDSADEPVIVESAEQPTQTEEDAVVEETPDLTQPAQTPVLETEETDPVSEKVDFNEDWKFHYGDVSGGQQVNLNDDSWDTVNVPHDYSSEQEYSADGEVESGFEAPSIAWYRKHFIVPARDQGSVIQIHFEGVYMNSTVYINGRKLGVHPYGYTPFSFDLSKDLIYDGITENILAVKIDHSRPSSRWYSGSGIFRDVYLTKQAKIYIPELGIITNTPDLESRLGGEIQTEIQTTVTNTWNQVKHIILSQTLFDKNYQQIANRDTAFTLAANRSVQLAQSLSLRNIELWSLNNPALYQLRTDLIFEGEVIDTKWTEIGFRYIRFDKESGFYLNGQPVKLQGVCLHTDFGSLGTAVNESALQRQLEMMKEMGANAIRVTHHPATTQLLNLCNRMGLLVIEEAFDTWTMTKAGNTYDYGYWFSTPIGKDNEILNREDCTNWVDYDLRQMVRHSVNAPSVIMYSLGNELLEGITNTRGKQNYLNHARYLIQTIQSMTKDKILTIGDNSHNKTVQADKELGIAINELIYQAGGVIGYNYTRKGKYTDLYEQFPWAMYGSEVASAVSTRDYYLTTGTDDENHQLIGDGSKAVSWGATPWDAWFEVISRDYVAGAFVWTGFDYGGEPSPWNSTGKSEDGSVNPKSSYFGIVDLAGIKKDSFYFYQSQWNRDVNTLHIAPYWTGDCLAKDENGNVKVVVFSNASAVELFLNGRSLGKQTFTKVTTENGYTYQLCNGQLYMTWTVPYEDGQLWAVAYDENGNPIDNTVGRNITKTAGQAATIRVTPGQQIIDADGRSLNYILVEALDENGEVDPRADFEVTMSSQGEGVVIASENGDPNDTRNRKSAVRNLFFGKAVFIVQSTKNAGNVVVSAMTDGLDAVSASFETRLPEEEDRPINTTYPKQLTDEMIQLIEDHLDYHGEPQSPEWTILEEALSENDLVIQGQTARDPGVYTMTITGKNNYTGTIQKTYEIVDRVLDGFVTVDGKTYYYQNGTKVKGQKQINGYWYMFEMKNGIMQTGWFEHDKTTNPSGGKKTVYYDGAGHMLYGYQWIGNNWYWLHTGSGNREYTGVVKNNADNRWYFVRNGIGEKYTGTSKSIENGNYYITKDGILDWNYTGFGKAVDSGKWLFVRKGKHDPTFTGVAKSIFNNQWYHGKNGVLDWNFTGFSKSVTNGKWYFSRNGKLDWNFTGVAKSVANGKWYFARKGALDWGYSGGGLSVANNKWYAVQKGSLNWNYNGTLKCTDNRTRTFLKGVAA